MSLLDRLLAESYRGIKPDAPVLGFATNDIETGAEQRSSNCLSGAIEKENTAYLVTLKDQIISNESGGILYNQNELIEQFNEEFLHYEAGILLGQRDGQWFVTVPLEPDTAEDINEERLLNARSIIYGDGISEANISLSGMALSLRHWHDTNRYCGRCAKPMKRGLGGMRLDCTACEAQVFPRTDPVAIMLVIHEDKCLLGRSPHFPEGWYSSLAGFVEPGETIEQTVRREVREESGVIAGDVGYFASQPWPFPHTLMIGCYAVAQDPTINFDGDELEDCRWFDRGEVFNMREKMHPQELKLPPAKSIAAHLISNWLTVINS